MSSTHEPDDRLSAMTQAARELQLPPAVVARAVRHAEHAAASRAEPRRPIWLFVLPAAAAAVALGVLLVAVPRRQVEPAAIPVTWSKGGAALAAPGARYDVTQTDAGTRVKLAAGVIGVRRAAGEPGVEVIAADVATAAQGTVVVAQLDGRVIIHVIAGSASVARGDARWQLGASETWMSDEVVLGAPPPELEGMAAAIGAAPTPFSAVPRDNPAATALGPEPAAPAPPPVEASLPVRRGAAQGQAAARAPTGAAPTAPPAEIWRLARRLTAQQRYAEAVVALQRLGNAGDPIWSPIAAAEVVRLLHDRLQDHAAAVAASARFETRWPSHALAPEVRDLACAASAALGRSAPQCQKTSQPMPTRKSATPR